MAKENDQPEQRPSQDGEETQEPEAQPSWLRRATNLAAQGFQRAGQEIRDASRSTGEVVQRSSEVFTGADIRRFDEFTEAVTRVAVGLHHHQTDSSQRIVKLEQDSADIRQSQGELAGRVAGLEQESADIRQSQGELAGQIAGLEQDSRDIQQLQSELAQRVTLLEQEMERRRSVGFLRRIWRALF